MKMSESIANISTALVQFQAQVTNPSKNADNNYFKSKYADLDSIINAIRPCLTANGLTFLQNPVGDGSGVGVYTLILHKSGEYIEFDPVVIPLSKKDAQQVGSAMTYARRYSLGAALGIATDEDDDANSIQPKPINQPQKKQSKQDNRNLDAWEDLADKNGAKASQRKRFFAITKKKKLTDKQQKAIVYFFSNKVSRSELSAKEFKDIADFVESATEQEIKNTIDEAIKKKQEQQKGGAA